MKSKNADYLPAVDHLRALAATLVLVYHGLQLFGHPLLYGAPHPSGPWYRTTSPFVAIVYEGHTAVALFFVLSGFVFAHGHRERSVQWQPFLLNRMLRIGPMFVLVLFVGASTVPNGFSLSGFLQHLLGFGNLPGALEGGPWTTVLWTVALEVQFYLLFPFLLPNLSSDTGLFGLKLLALLLVVRLIAVCSGAAPGFLVYHTIIGRLDQFVVGMMLGLAYRRENSPRPLLAGLRLACASLVVAVVLFLYHLAGGYPANAVWKIMWPTIEAGAWAFFVSAYLGASVFVPRFVSRPLAAVGTISYSMYLLHVPLTESILSFGAFVDVDGRPMVTAAATSIFVLLPLTLLICSLTYSTIEKPFLAMRLRYDDYRTSDAPIATVAPTVQSATATPVADPVSAP